MTPLRLLRPPPRLPHAAAPAPQKQFTVGFIYVGSKSDYGYNQAHAEGAKTLTGMGIKIREEENVPETLDVQKTMESMINLDGASVLFPTSFGYFDPHILKMAEKYPNVIFLHCGGMYTEGKHPKNVGSYFGYIDEAQYVAGIVAGMTTKTNKLGFVAAKPIPQVLRNINSYTLGAQSVNPKVTMSVIFTGDWSMPVKEAEAANSLIDQGADVLTCHVDSPKVVIETAERRGVFSTGYHANQAALAPKGYLTGAEWNWETVYKDYVEKIQKGKPWEHLVRGGFKEGFIKMSAVRRGRVRRRQGQGRRSQGEVHGWHARDLRGPAQGQRRQRGHRRRHRAWLRATSSSKAWATWSTA